MASKRLLKKDANNVFGEIIDAAYLHQAVHPEENPSKSEAIVDEAIENFDIIISKINKRDVENRKKHLQETKAELEERAQKLIEKLNTL